MLVITPLSVVLQAETLANGKPSQGVRPGKYGPSPDVIPLVWPAHARVEACHQNRADKIGQKIAQTKEAGDWTL